MEEGKVLRVVHTGADVDVVLLTTETLRWNWENDLAWTWD